MSYEAFASTIHLITSSEPEDRDDEAVFSALAPRATAPRPRLAGRNRTAPPRPSRPGRKSSAGARG